MLSLIQNNNRHHFIAQAHPMRAVGEGYALGAFFLLVLLSLQTELAPVVVQQGLFFISAGVAVWTALRLRPPTGHWLRRLLSELVPGLLAGSPSVLFELIFRIQLLNPNWVGGFFLLVGVIGFLCFRAGVGVWLFWDRLRRRRLIWSITHAILTTVVVLALLFVVGLTLLSINYGPASELLAPEASPFASFAAQVLNRFLPLASVMAVFTVIGLALVLPPAIVFSYFVARGLTRRLEQLARATRTVRSGDYEVRVNVSGQDEIAQLQGDFNAMITDLDRSMRDLQAERDRVAALLNERRELIANVSHELRTPVSTLRGYLESTLSNWGSASPGTVRHDLEIMDRETDRLQTLIDDLFALARAEVGQLTLHCQPIDLGALAQRVAETIAPLAWQTGRVQVAAEIQSGAVAFADEIRLEQVLRNLIYNGVRHTPPGGIVAVIVRPDRAAAILEVRDTGEGIAPEDLPHVWERFYRSEQTRHHDQAGAGLGLALVKELIEAMGGAVSVTSRLGEGSCFTISLPVEGEETHNVNVYPQYPESVAAKCS
jgi:signal transduction histidine kinase